MCSWLSNLIQCQFQIDPFMQHSTSVSFIELLNVFILFIFETARKILFSCCILLKWYKIRQNNTFCGVHNFFFLSLYLNFCHYAQTIPSSAFVKQHNTLTKKMHEFEIMIFISFCRIILLKTNFGKPSVGSWEDVVLMWVKWRFVDERKWKNSLDSKLPTALEIQGWPKVTPSLQCKCKGALGFKPANEKHQTSTESCNTSACNQIDHL